MTEGKVLVKEAMNTKPVTINPETTVKNAAVLMREKDIGNCLVVKNKKPIGIITESDIIKKVVALDLKASEIPVEKVMTTPLIISDPYIEIEEAMKIMSKSKIRRLPIIEKGELTGIITEKDIFRLSPMLLELSREWRNIVTPEEAGYRDQIFSGKCEDCGMLSTNLRNVNGLLLCEDCRENRGIR